MFNISKYFCFRCEVGNVLLEILEKVEITCEVENIMENILQVVEDFGVNCKFGLK